MLDDAYSRVFILLELSRTVSELRIMSARAGSSRVAVQQIAQTENSDPLDEEERRDEGRARFCYDLPAAGIETPVLRGL